MRLPSSSVSMCAFFSRNAQKTLWSLGIPFFARLYDGF